MYVHMYTSVCTYVFECLRVCIYVYIGMNVHVFAFSKSAFYLWILLLTYYLTTFVLEILLLPLNSSMGRENKLHVDH